MEKHPTHRHNFTHWNSFWFGFMVALATVLVCLLILTFTEHISFDVPQNKAVEKIQEEKPDNQNVSQTLSEIVASLDMDADTVRNCVLDKTYIQNVQDDNDSGEKAGVRGTPHSFVLIDQAIYEIPGAYDEAGMRMFFDDLLAGKNPQAKDISAKTDLVPVTDSDWMRGPKDARITVVMYSDMDCPYCKDFHGSVSNMMPDYADSVRWVFRHMPVDTLHPYAREKAETAECVGAIGGTDKFWAFLDAMFIQQ